MSPFAAFPPAPSTQPIAATGAAPAVGPAHRAEVEGPGATLLVLRTARVMGDGLLRRPPPGSEVVPSPSGRVTSGPGTHDRRRSCD